jgi:hypothetical protein
LLCLIAISILFLILPACLLFPSSPYIPLERGRVHERNPSLSTCGDPPIGRVSSESTSLISGEEEIKPKHTTIGTILHTLVSHYKHSIDLFKEIITSSPLRYLLHHASYPPFVPLN